MQANDISEKRLLIAQLFCVYCAARIAEHRALSRDKITLARTRHRFSRVNLSMSFLLSVRPGFSC